MNIATKIIQFNPEILRHYKEVFGKECKVYYTDGEHSEDIQLVEFDNVDNGNPPYAGVIDRKITIIYPTMWNKLSIVVPIRTRLVDFDPNTQNVLSVYYCVDKSVIKLYEYHLFKSGKLVCVFKQIDECGNPYYEYNENISQSELKMEVEL